MKTKILFVVLTLFVITSFGCKKKEAAATTASPSKATLSSWHVSNSAWFARLDVNGANLNGVSYTEVFKYSDNSEVHCANTIMSGTESFGSYDTGLCTGPGTASMADTGPHNFETSGGGTYSNNGSVLKLCRTGTNSCTSYY